MPPFNQNPSNNYKDSPKEPSRRDFLKSALATGVGVAASTAGFDIEAKGSRGITKFERYMDELRSKIVNCSEIVAYLEKLSEDDTEVINKHFASSFQKSITDPKVTAISSPVIGGIAGVALGAHTAKKENLDPAYSILAGLPGTLVGSVLGGAAVATNEYLIKPEIVHNMSHDLERYFVENFFDKNKLLTKETIFEEIKSLENRKIELLDILKRTKEETFSM